MDNEFFDYEYDFLGSCKHNIHGSSDIEIPEEHENICPFCNKNVVLRIVKKRKVLKEQVFKKICKEIFPECIKVDNVVYYFDAHQIMGHRTCRMSYYNGKLNKSLIEAFVQEPNDCIKEFMKKLENINYEKISEKE